MRTTERGTVSHLSWSVAHLYALLKGSKNILEKLGYQGSLVGKMEVEGLQGYKVLPIINTFFLSENKDAVYPNYSWELNIDTRKLANEAELREYVAQVSRDVHWSFGYKDIQKSINVAFLEKERYFAE